MSLLPLVPDWLEFEAALLRWQLHRFRGLDKCVCCHADALPGLLSRLNRSIDSRGCDRRKRVRVRQHHVGRPPLQGGVSHKGLRPESHNKSSFEREREVSFSRFFKIFLLPPTISPVPQPKASHVILDSASRQVHLGSPTEVQTRSLVVLNHTIRERGLGFIHGNKALLLALRQVAGVEPCLRPLHKAHGLLLAPADAQVDVLA